MSWKITVTVSLLDSMDLFVVAPVLGRPSAVMLFFSLTPPQKNPNLTNKQTDKQKRLAFESTQSILGSDVFIYVHRKRPLQILVGLGGSLPPTAVLIWGLSNSTEQG